MQIANIVLFRITDAHKILPFKFTITSPIGMVSVQYYKFSWLRILQAVLVDVTSLTLHIIMYKISTVE